MQRKGNRVLLLFLSVIFLAACSTKKNVAVQSATEKTLTEIVSVSPASTVSVESLASSVRLSADIGGKSFTARGTLRVKSGEGVQLGFTALGLVEVACAEFLPSTMRLIYKLGKEYAAIPYTDISFLRDTGIGYGLIESMMLNRIYSPDGKPLDEAVRYMSLDDDGETIKATTRQYNGIVYSFFIEKATGNLVRSEGHYKGHEGVVCLYSDFKPVDGRHCPHKIQLRVTGTGKAVSLDFELGNIEIDNMRFNMRNIPSSYRKLDVDSLLELIGNI